MIRIIKRYESRKLYDTEESRYVALEDIAKWVRVGQEVKVIDNATSGDVTAQILTQIILDEGKRGTSFLPSELLHDLVRAGEKAVATGVERVQGKVDRLVQASMDRLAPVRQAREEMGHLRDRLGELEQTLSSLEDETGSAPVAPAPRKPAATKPVANKASSAKPAARKPAARKTAVRKPAAAKTVAQKATVKKATAKKATVKKAAVKEAAVKETAVKKTAETEAAN